MDKARSSYRVPLSQSPLTTNRRSGGSSGTASTEAGGSEGDDERPRDDTAEIVPDEGLHIVEQTNSVGLLHHLGAGVREHQVPVVRSAVRLVPVVLADLNAFESTICVKHRTNLRIDVSKFTHYLMLDEKLRVGRFDGRFTGTDPGGVLDTPFYDPTDSSISPPFTSVFNNYLRTELGYKTDMPYYTHAQDADFEKWNWGSAIGGFPDTATAIREAIVKNPFLRILVMEGYYDLATPYSAANYTIDHLDLPPRYRNNISFVTYEAGHMVYLPEAGLKQMKNDQANFIAQSAANLPAAQGPNAPGKNAASPAREDEDTGTWPNPYSSEDQPVTSVRFLSGESLQVTTGPESPGEEYYDPDQSGNPLLDTSGRNRGKRLSDNLTVAEIAHAGSAAFSKARIDPLLVVLLQSIRDFIRQPLEVIDGYYSYKYLAGLATTQKPTDVSNSPHASGRAARFRASGIASVDLAKWAMISAQENTRIGVGDDIVTMHLNQSLADPFSYISNGEKRDRALRILREYRELYFGIPIDIVLAIDKDISGGNGLRLAHWAVHEKEVRDEQTIAEIIFYRSWFVRQSRGKQAGNEKFDRSSPTDRALWARILSECVHPVLAEVKGPAVQRGGDPTSPKGKRVEVDAKPDSPGFDITGRYEKTYKVGEELGKIMHVNQAGKRVELILSQVLSSSVTPARYRTYYRLSGDLLDGTKSFELFNKRNRSPIFHLKSNGNSLDFEWVENGKTKLETFTRISNTPFLTEGGLHAFDDLEGLATAYEWLPLLSSQVQHIREFCGDETRINKYLKDFYDAEGNALNQWKEDAQGRAARKFDDEFTKWIKDPRLGFHVNDQVLAQFYIRYYLTLSKWRPHDNYPYLSQLDWIYRIVAIIKEASIHEPNRLGTTSAFNVTGGLMQYAGVDPGALADGHVHTYKVTLVLTGAGLIVGGFKGHITIEKTDDQKWPTGPVTFGVWFAAFGVSLEISKKGIEEGKFAGPFTKFEQKLVGTASSSIGWLPHDFPGRADFFMMDASVSAGVKATAGGWFLHIHGRGGLPELEVVEEGLKAGIGKPKIGAELMGALGKITDKDIPTTGFASMRQKTDYVESYGLNTETHFGNDSAVLSDEAREAVRALCANEMVALMNPASKVVIVGHTDSTDTAERNLTLSKLRAGNTAQAVKDIMGTKFLATMEAYGHGEAEANKAGEQNYRNLDRRRVDIELNGRIVLQLREKA